MARGGRLQQEPGPATFGRGENVLQYLQMTRIAIVAALPGELRPLIRGWTPRGSLFYGRLGDSEAVATCAGMGAGAVTRACEQVLAASHPDTLVSIGWAGSLSCGLQPPQACAVREVIEASSGERFPTASGEGQRLITLGHVAGGPEKRSLAAQYQAVLVDMEAATVARIARDRGMAFLCFKGISDGPNDKLPDFNRFMGEDGQLRMPAFLLWAAVHPGSWRGVVRLGRNSRAAAEELANLVALRLSERRQTRA